MHNVNSLGCNAAIKVNLFTHEITPVEPLQTDAQKYKLNIDCYDPGLDSAETADRIKITYFNGDKQVGEEKSLPPFCDSINDAIYDTKNNEDITHFIIQTDGTDAFWMDEVFLEDSEGDRRLYTWGMDGGYGYCLSRDPSDAQRLERNDGCYSAIKFDIFTMAAYPATPVGEEPISISKKQADFVINRHFDTNTDGAEINLWQDTGLISQKWIFSNDNITSLTAQNFCLNLHNNDISNGAEINLWKCNGHNSQKWIRQGETIRLKQNPNYCLNLHYNDHYSGSIVNLWECNGHDSQNWVFK